VLDDDRRVVGILSISDLMGAYRRELIASVERLGDLGAGTATFEIRISADSPAAGRQLRAAGLPRGVLVTSISRGGHVILPSGDTVVVVGDRLSLFGERRGAETIGEIAPLGSASSRGRG
jgi:Trk K+ transport system NAD-binding subunit